MAYQAAQTKSKSNYGYGATHKERHTRTAYYIVGEGLCTFGPNGKPSCQPLPEPPVDQFRFSRLGPKGIVLDDALLEAVAKAMTDPALPQVDSASPTIPAGYTYLGQFVDHDFTRMNTPAQLGDVIDVNDPTLVQQRSPALDLDSLYGRGPADAESGRFYEADGRKLKVGTTEATTFTQNGAVVNVDKPGFDLPRESGAPTPDEKKRAAIPDLRNDENLAVGQTHLAMMRFHNRVADTTPGTFATVRAKVVKHYQWMLKTDFLPRICDQAIIDNVFNNGRQFFEVSPAAGSFPTMPVEFSVAAFRLGHSMIREVYAWNRVFRAQGGASGSLLQLFNFSGTSGNLTPNPGGPPAERLPTNWIANFLQLFDFSGFGPAFLPPDAMNIAHRIDTSLVDPLALLPPGSFGASAAPNPARLSNLAFRNLMRANMVELASGQQMAQMMGVTPLSANAILTGNGSPGSVNLSSLTAAQKATFTANTPLWFYILREAELNGGKLTGVGGRIVAEVFHRGMEGSADSIVKDTAFQPSLGPNQNTFRMVDLMMFAFENNAALLNPLG